MDDSTTLPKPPPCPPDPTDPVTLTRALELAQSIEEETQRKRREEEDARTEAIKQRYIDTLRSALKQEPAALGDLCGFHIIYNGGGYNDCRLGWKVGDVQGKASLESDFWYLWVGKESKGIKVSIGALSAKILLAAQAEREKNARAAQRKAEEQARQAEIDRIAAAERKAVEEARAETQAHLREEWDRAEVEDRQNFPKVEALRSLTYQWPAAKSLTLYYVSWETGSAYASDLGAAVPSRDGGWSLTGQPDSFGFYDLDGGARSVKPPAERLVIERFRVESLSALVALNQYGDNLIEDHVHVLDGVAEVVFKNPDTGRDHVRLVYRDGAFYRVRAGFRPVAWVREALGVV